VQPPDVRTEVERVLDRPPSRTQTHFDRARTLLRDLASREPTDAPLISAYLDLRRPGDATDPAVREARVVLRRRRDELRVSVAKHGPGKESFEADGDRIESLLESVGQQGERGLAAFACRRDSLFASLLAWEPFASRVDAGPLPFLLPLARLVDHEPTLVAVADTNALRLFTSQPGRLEELPGIEDDDDPYHRTDAGSPAQAEHRVDELRSDFARRASAIVARSIATEEAERLILGGPEAATTLLREHLPKAAADRLRATVRVGRASHGEIESAVLPLIARLEADDAIDAADRLMGAVAANGAGVVGLEATRERVEYGQGLELLVDEGGAVSEAQVEELVRLAARVGTRITFVTEHQGLLDAGGVGMLLRYRA
jgi:hypothetical protein